MRIDHDRYRVTMDSDRFDELTVTVEIKDLMSNFYVNMKVCPFSINTAIEMAIEFVEKKRSDALKAQEEARR